MPNLKLVTNIIVLYYLLLFLVTRRSSIIIHDILAGYVKITGIYKLNIQIINAQEINCLTFPKEYAFGAAK